MYSLLVIVIILWPPAGQQVGIYFTFRYVFVHIILAIVTTLLHKLFRTYFSLIVHPASNRKEQPRCLYIAELLKVFGNRHVPISVRVSGASLIFDGDASRAKSRTYLYDRSITDDLGLRLRSYQRCARNVFFMNACLCSLRAAVSTRAMLCEDEGMQNEQIDRHVLVTTTVV